MECRCGHILDEHVIVRDEDGFWVQCGDIGCYCLDFEPKDAPVAQ